MNLRRSITETETALVRAYHGEISLFALDAVVIHNSIRKIELILYIAPVSHFENHAVAVVYHYRILIAHINGRHAHIFHFSECGNKLGKRFLLMVVR